MIGSWIKKYQANKAVKNFKNSQLGKCISHHTEKYFYGDTLLSSFQQENKENIIKDFHHRVFMVCLSDNPFMSMREAITEYGCGLSSYQIYCINESNKADSEYANTPYISGKMHKHISSCSDHVDELKEMKWKYPEISNDDLIAFCNSRAALYTYYLNGMNYVRMELKDSDDTKDWLRPFVKSMLIWTEDHMRSNIGLPSLLENSLDGLKHSTFMNLVADGHKNPYFEWETKWASE
ncbi:hypothetical protein [Parendozoicomonas sp. Alg238-R29]|uniref:hypothetical protein n=1 Tax=Parendozoicomonas sp. Alg238-R29 TaxID=2993446 RepID=UPI00248F3FA7|nr:hypothetical protein [Parendozoicomonas sp. Alg238-R29]